MSHSGDDIDHVRMPRQNRRQRANDVFNALVGGKQAEGQKNGLAFRAKPVFKIVGVHERQIRHTVRNHIDLSIRNRIHIAQKLRRQFAHDNQAIGEPRDLFQHGALIRVRLAQNRVQRGHHRHLQSAQQGRMWQPARAAVDAIFMLQANKIVAVEVEKIGGPLIGARSSCVSSRRTCSG